MNCVKNHTKYATFLVIFIYVLLLSGRVPAAGPPMLGEILDKTEANYKQFQAFTASFRQTTTSSAAGTVTPGEATGRLYYAKPRQMRWEYDKPEVQVFVANNNYAWLYVPSENQVSLFDSKKLFASPLAQAFFSGAGGLKKNFEITLDSALSTSGSAVLKLVPGQEDPNIKILFLWIDLKTYRISRLESQDILGNTNRIILESLSPVSNIDHRLFHLEIPRGTHVLDIEGRELPLAEIEQLKSKIASGKSP
jgi:outer membrane lipoprotein carrier protein